MLNEMDISDKSLQKIHKLAAVVERFLDQSVDVSSLGGIHALLKTAAEETLDQNIVIRYSDFMSTVTQAEQAALSLYKLTDAGSQKETQVIKRPSSQIINRAESVEDEVLNLAGSSVVTVKPGTVIKQTEVASNEATLIKMYRGVAIEANGSETHNKPHDPLAVVDGRKIKGVYRGQTIYYD